MQKRWIIAPVLALALLSLNPRAQGCTITDGDNPAVADTIRNLYSGATTNDMARMRNVLAPTFYIYDNGHQCSSIDDLMKVITDFRNQGVKFVWNVINPSVTVRCNDAWETWVNDGSVQLPNNPTPTPVQWLESAILEKHDGVWKMVFMHSTRVPAAPTPAK